MHSVIILFKISQLSIPICSAVEVIFECENNIIYKNFSFEGDVKSL